MRQITLGLALCLLLLGGRPALAANAALDQAMGEMALGRADAPVVVQEWASLTCPHCATFHRDTLPQIRKDYVETGKVRFVYNDFPLDNLAMAGAMLARCSGPQRYFGMIEVLFRAQERWSRSKNPRDDLERVARLGGMSPTEVDACLNDGALLKALQERARAAQEKHGISSTPSFVVEGEVYAGALSYAEFKDILDKALAGKKK